MTRSSSPTVFCELLALSLVSGAAEASVEPSRTAVAAAEECLATVPPCDHQSENNVQTAEAGDQPSVGPGGRAEHGRQTERQKPGAHGRDELGGKRTARGDGGAVEQEPHTG